MSEALISIIIPVYNVEKYLDECIASVVNQTYKNLEIILIDDGSPDKCPRMCDNWANRDERIKVFHQENGGLSSARNKGLDIASGDYIGFVDSDDYIEADMYEIMFNALNESGKKISCCLINRIFEDGTIISDMNMYKGDIVLDVEDAIHEIFCKSVGNAVWGKLYEKTIFETMRFPVGEINEDFPVIVPSIVSSDGMALINKPLYTYRKRGDSITGNKTKIPARTSYIVRKNLNLIGNQLKKYNLHCEKCFKFFSARVSFSFAIVMEKNYTLLNDEEKEELSLLKNKMRESLFAYLSSSNSSFKDKLLYILVLSGKLETLYRIFGKSL